MATAIVRNKIRWGYHSDDGLTYAINAIKGYTDQDKLGGEAAGTSVPPLPRGMKMRRQTVRNATLGVSRTVPIYNSADANLMAVGQAINLNHVDLTQQTPVELSYAFSVFEVHIIPEQNGRQRATTKQST